MRKQSVELEYTVVTQVVINTSAALTATTDLY